jgi:hypothetical protein
MVSTNKIVGITLPGPPTDHILRRLNTNLCKGVNTRYKKKKK